MRVLALAMVALALGACSTITKGTDQVVGVNTPGAPGAICTLASPAIGSIAVRTPGSTTLPKSRHDVQVTCTLDCFQDGACVIPSNFEGMTFGNIIFGGIIGVGVDAATGAMNKYASSVSVVMRRAESCERAPLVQRLIRKVHAGG